ncbi:olfactory receptor 52K2-like [Phyllobates terribilis]|uniref:olfactory receptor 52K2-like n=1 Tax=Phyllobates terribilis TaxID=111132 RepID=UPI003CCB1A2A
MLNSTLFNPSQMSLGFGDLSDVGYLYSVITLLGFLLIILCNSTVISTILLNKSLQEPMYIFICALCANDLYGSSAFYPSLFTNLSMKTRSISYTACLIQVFCIYTFAACESSILAIMAFDRYVCICNPLRYSTIMTLYTTYKLLFSAWGYCFALITVLVVLTARLPLCGNVIPKIYCDNWTVVRLSCVDTTVNNVFGLFTTVCVIVLMPLLILMSYIEILKVCTKSKEARAKAMQTCTPQIISMLIFFADCIFEVMLYRFIPSMVPYGLRVVMSVHLFVLPPIVNPILYGLKMTTIKEKICQLFNSFVWYLVLNKS